jgi:hypothetical protein
MVILNTYVALFYKKEGASTEKWLEGASGF